MLPFRQNRCNCATLRATRELNGGIRSLRSRFCTECYSDARHLNAEFSHTLGSGWVLLAIDNVQRTNLEKLHSETHPLPQGGTDLMGLRHERVRPSPTAVGGIPSFTHKFYWSKSCQQRAA